MTNALTGLTQLFQVAAQKQNQRGRMSFQQLCVYANVRETFVFRTSKGRGL